MLAAHILENENEGELVRVYTRNEDGTRIECHRLWKLPEDSKFMDERWNGGARSFTSYRRENGSWKFIGGIGWNLVEGDLGNGVLAVHYFSHK